MSKYIIELDDRIKLVTSVGVTENGVVYTTSDYVHNLEELNSDYINEHYGQLQDEAYQRGYKDCETRYCSFDACPNRQAEYQRGLDDAWEAARKISLMSPDEIEKVFPGAAKYNRYNLGYSGVEAIEKLKAYEEKQNDKIEVGDTVDLKDAVSDKGGGIVTKIWDNDCCYIVWYDGSGGAWAKDMLVKTGKHIDIASILEDMRND